VSDENGTKGPQKPGGGKDLDALKAKLGLGATRKPASPLAGKPKEEPKQRSAADDFKFSFGDAGGKEEKAFSAQELAAIDAEAQRAASPLGRKIISGAIGLVLVIIVMWLGYQFGNSMGMRVLHNEAVKQAAEMKDFFLKKYANVTGEEIDARRDTTTRFVDQFDAYLEEHITGLMNLAKLLEEGKIPPDFDMEKFRKEELEPLKSLCKDYLQGVEEYSVASILKGQLYSTELGAKLLEFADRANKLRNRVETLYLSIEIVEAYVQSGEMPKDLKGEVLVHGVKPENEKDKVPEIAVVELNGQPEIDKELTTKEVCEPIAIELEIPVCGGRGEPEVEKRLIDTYDKKEVQEVKQFRKVKVKNADGKSVTARIEHLFKMDLKPFLKPLIERISADKKLELENLAIVLNTLIQNMNDVRMAGEAVDFKDLLDAVDKYAGQETFFTF
jgi:hypothetical protein